MGAEGGERTRWPPEGASAACLRRCHLIEGRPVEGYGPERRVEGIPATSSRELSRDLRLRRRRTPRVGRSHRTPPGGLPLADSALSMSPSRDLTPLRPTTAFIVAASPRQCRCHPSQVSQSRRGICRFRQSSHGRYRPLPHPQAPAGHGAVRRRQPDPPAQPSLVSSLVACRWTTHPPGSHPVDVSTNPVGAQPPARQRFLVRGDESRFVAHLSRHTSRGRTR